MNKLDFTKNADYGNIFIESGLVEMVDRLVGEDRLKDAADLINGAWNTSPEWGERIQVAMEIHNTEMALRLSKFLWEHGISFINTARCF